MAANHLMSPAVASTESSAFQVLDFLVSEEVFTPKAFDNVSPAWERSDYAGKWVWI